jgi:hypothetical protein
VRCNGTDRADADRLGGETVNVVGVAVGTPVRLIVPCGGLRSVPTLGGAATVAAASDVLVKTPEPADAKDAPQTDPRRPFAAVILLAAAVLLASTAWMRHRSGAGEADEAAAPARSEGGDGPRLALVRVRNEQGP